MRTQVVAVALLLFCYSVAATTITLHFSYDLFENETLKNTTINEVLLNMTAPQFAIDGFKLRGEDFAALGSEYFRTYNTSDNQTMTVFEIWAWRNKQVEQKTTEVNSLLNSTLITLNTTRKERDDAYAMSPQNLWATMQVFFNIVIVVGIVCVILLIIWRYKKKNEGYVQHNWTPEVPRVPAQEMEDSFVEYAKYR